MTLWQISKSALHLNISMPMDFSKYFHLKPVHFCSERITINVLVSERSPEYRLPLIEHLCNSDRPCSSSKWRWSAVTNDMSGNCSIIVRFRSLFWRDDGRSIKFGFKTFNFQRFSKRCQLDGASGKFRPIRRRSRGIDLKTHLGQNCWVAWCINEFC